MNIFIETETVDVIVLCGGKGKRLRTTVKDRPKCLAEIDGRPFLDILVDYVASFGFKRFILCIGYKGDFIKKHYQNRNVPFEVLFSEEKKLLGTAGAIKNAQPFIKSNPFLVMNGDSICQLELDGFINFHMKKKALFSVALSKAQNRSDCGKVVLDSMEKVTGFNEKIRSESKDSFVNTGIYLLDEAIFSEIPKNKRCSIEYEVFPKIANRRFYGFVTGKKLIDIGTPERFRQAKVALRSV